jgi:hypothetical protein
MDQFPAYYIERESGESFPPRCRRCAYVLTGLPPGRCPECGAHVDPTNAWTFTVKPPKLAWKLWLPGLVLAIGGGVLSTAALLAMGSWGVALWFAVPFAAGALLGYRVRCGVFMLVLLALVVAGSLIMGMVSMNVAGVFCGLVLAGMFIGPILIGTLLGSLLRSILKASKFSQRWHLPVWILLAVPMTAGLIEGRPGTRHAIESIETTATLPVDAATAFESIMFYEEVRHPPPLILRIGLAHPLFTSGSSQRVGDVKSCIYNKGHITKRITAIEPARRLAFEVIEQDIGYEIDVRLVGGAFEFEPLPDGSTRITLVTEYEPLLNPRWCWRPFERYAVHTLHEHVIEGMRRLATGEDALRTSGNGNVQPLAWTGGADAR